MLDQHFSTYFNVFYVLVQYILNTCQHFLKYFFNIFQIPVELFQIFFQHFLHDQFFFKYLFNIFLEYLFNIVQILVQHFKNSLSILSTTCSTFFKMFFVIYVYIIWKYKENIKRKQTTKTKQYGKRTKQKTGWCFPRGSAGPTGVPFRARGRSCLA